MKKLQINAFAKINLILLVKGKRSDGYHELKTVFQEINLKDVIRLESQSAKISLFARGLSVPKGKENLAVKAALLLKQEADIPGAGVKIILDKRIPAGAGLGGGSSDAAAVLKGLNQLWGLRWPVRRLLGLAVKLGSDVPFFLKGGTVLARGRGEKFSVFPHLPRKWVVLAWPGFSVSTKWVFSQYRARLFKGKPRVKLLAQAIQRNRMDQAFPLLANDLENVVLKKYPVLQAIKDKMAQFGACASLMTGSGSMVFGMVRSRKQGEWLAKQMKPYCKKTWVVSTR